MTNPNRTHILQCRYTLPDDPTHFKGWSSEALTDLNVHDYLANFEAKVANKSGRVEFVRVYTTDTPYADLVWLKLCDDREMHFSDKFNAFRKEMGDNLTVRILFETPEHIDFRKGQREKWLARNTTNISSSLDLTGV